MKSESNPYNLPEVERQRCEIWTRVMGYHRPVSSFNTGKKEEYTERRFFREVPVQSVHNSGGS